MAYSGALQVQNASTISLTLLIAWTLALLILMEVLRSRLVLTGRMAGRELRPDNANLSPFMQRLARAHANCIEGLPVFGGLLAVAIMTDRTDVTNGLAYVLVAARVIQSTIHLISTSETAVTLRFLVFVVQLAIAVYWTGALLIG
jgi:uncharacterized MAPEG superfamily protein